MPSHHITVEKTRIDISGHYYLVIPDNAAGSRGRYTVYQLPGAEYESRPIVGREVTLTWARHIVADLERMERKKRKK